jgi:hypothetical protein
VRASFDSRETARVSRFARDDEVTAWRDDGWVVLQGLIDTGEIDAALDDLHRIFPRAEEFHADPARYTPPGRSDEDLRRGYPAMPESGPAFRPEQHRWFGEFPFRGNGALNRLTVHPSIVDFMERALETTDIRLYQCQVNAKYTGSANYEQPMHADQNHSYLPPVPGMPFQHVETFLFLSDVDDGVAPTHLVSRRHSSDYKVGGAYLPNTAPELFENERPARGVRGSLLVYRNDVFHRAVDLTRPGGARFLLNVSYKVAGHDWIGYHSVQSRVNHPAWARFVEGSTPRELELFGFPPPGHEIWDQALVEATACRYPGLDLDPWRAAIDRG